MIIALASIAFSSLPAPASGRTSHSEARKALEGKGINRGDVLAVAGATLLVLVGAFVVSPDTYVANAVIAAGVGGVIALLITRGKREER